MAGSSANAQYRESEDERWKELMILAQGGDSTAYNQLLREISQCLEQFANRYLKHWSSVDDCVQECLISMHKARHTYDPARPFRPWLYAIARNRITDHFRKQNRQCLKETDTFDEHIHGTNSESSEAANCYNELHMLLNKLDSTFREPIILVKLEGRSIKEVAASIGISESLVKVRVHRGMQQLQKLLLEQLG